MCSLCGGGTELLPRAWAALSPQTGILAVTWALQGRPQGFPGTPTVTWGSQGSAVGCGGDLAEGRMGPSVSGSIPGMHGASAHRPGQ